MRALDAILFDMGGTLDGRGGWRDRFGRLFNDAGLDGLSRARRMAAFDYAEERSHADADMGTACLRRMLEHHVAWQLEHLGIAEPRTARSLVDRFVSDVEQAAAINRRVLATLVEQGLRLGVVSNACGNAAVLCDELGYSPMLSVVVDSHRLGVAKPDVAIFRHALEQLKAAPERSAMVGDSLDRDIRPAKALGMLTFWVSDTSDTSWVSDTSVADIRLDSIAELPARLQLDLRPA